jgi:hypothetical protein
MTLEKVRRFDVSHALVHLTKERVRWEGTFKVNEQMTKHETAAFDVLKEILKDGKIAASTGYVKGARSVVCFSEMPLSAIRTFAQLPSETPARYRFYGIALSKETVFRVGGRPVIYLPDKEGDWIPYNEKWRHVRFEYGQVDWTHEREWRMPGDLDLTQVPGFYVIVWGASEATEVGQMESPVKEKIRGILPMEHLNDML